MIHLNWIRVIHTYVVIIHVMVVQNTPIMKFILMPMFKYGNDPFYLECGSDTGTVVNFAVTPMEPYQKRLYECWKLLQLKLLLCFTPELLTYSIFTAELIDSINRKGGDGDDYDKESQNGLRVLSDISISFMIGPLVQTCTSKILRKFQKGNI